MTVRQAATEADYAAARALILEYVEWLAEDFCSAGFEDEVRDLQRTYGPPGGALLIAEDEGAALGCVAYRWLEDGVCEMKRMYVVPAARGRDLGRRLAKELIAAAREAGYRRMLLDTLPKLVAAHGLYRSLGFEATEPYYDNPIPGVTFMALDLEAAPVAAPYSDSV